MEVVLVLFLGCSIVFWNFLGYLEQQQYWTLRFQLSLWEPRLILLPASALCLLLLCIGLRIEFDNFVQDFMSPLFFRETTIYTVDALQKGLRVVMGILLIGLLIYLFRVVVPLVGSGRYLRLRWKAWTGPSRTGIGSKFSKFIGDEDAWVDMYYALSLGPQHPVEKFSQILPSYSGFQGIEADPTDLLKALVTAVTKGSLVTPRSKFKAGVYQPVSDDQSVSLLWGQHLGFQRRCSRGIISVPRSFLNSRPTFDSGRDGRAVCLAYGILARNKGLEPWNLACNLGRSGCLGIFEENSVQWPRPSKILRSVYRAEFSRTFSLLGDAYVTAATELALLLADTSDDLLEDWLDGMMEHQDLRLNRQVAALGASGEDLNRLYKGQYAAMLVSLSTHEKGIRLRPELLVHDALCRLEGVEIRAEWASATAVVDRRRQELAHLGSSGQRLISAII